MKYIDPEVEYWQYDGTNMDAHVARCARVCYASSKETDNEKMVAGLIKNGHLSMLRHASHYYIINCHQKMKEQWVLHFLQNTPYAGVYVEKRKRAFISTNGQFVYENQDLFRKYLGNNEVTLPQFLYKGRNSKGVLMLVRHTLCITTQVSTSRELNRVSPNNIAEQSTRYVNFGKKGGVAVARPWWMWATKRERGFGFLASVVFRIAYHVASAAYGLLLRLNVKPQDARGILPLDVGTKVVYTYSGYEWKHILDLRLRGTTGAPHPNARKVAAKIENEISKAMALYKEEYQRQQK